mmetsp:Transcript_31567/g.76217  ORF Transcript_31567/g.76217 Transcript_31567/m.76217 type:complete len:276 (+) Transcript_31567:2389-3216(+)
MMLSRPSKALASLSSTTRVTATATAIRASFSTAPKYDWSSPNIPKNSLITGEEGVHQTMKTTKSWRNKPLFRRQGDVRFKTGMEASNLLVREALRRDAHEEEYIESLTATLQCLSPIFDRNPKYAFVAKTLIEPERFLQFRVAWIDDLGINRLNRGWRVQYSSALGPYSGCLHFWSPHESQCGALLSRIWSSLCQCRHWISTWIGCGWIRFQSIGPSRKENYPTLLPILHDRIGQLCGIGSRFSMDGTRCRTKRKKWDTCLVNTRELSDKCRTTF